MILSVWQSFRRLPVWVQVWVALILVPANLLPLLFLGEAGTFWIAVLSVGGMALNLPILLAQRGMSKAMALTHVLLWTPLVILLARLLIGQELAGGFALAMAVLLLVDVISLAFDYVDAWAWWRGDRAIA